MASAHRVQSQSELERAHHRNPTRLRIVESIYLIVNTAAALVTVP